MLEDSSGLGWAGKAAARLVRLILVDGEDSLQKLEIRECLVLSGEA